MTDNSGLVTAVDNQAPCGSHSPRMAASPFQPLKFEIKKGMVKWSEKYPLLDYIMAKVVVTCFIHEK